MFIFLSSDSLLQYGREDLEVPGQALVSLQIPDVETAGIPHREDTKEPSHSSSGLIGLRMTTKMLPWADCCMAFATYSNCRG